MRGIYEAAFEMGSGAMINIPRLIKIGIGNQKSIAGDTQTHRQQCDIISLFYFFKIKKVG
jgi:hypothetical protein